MKCDKRDMSGIYPAYHGWLSVFGRHMMDSFLQISVRRKIYVVALIVAYLGSRLYFVRWRGAKVAWSVFLAGGVLGLIVWSTSLNASTVAHPECANLPQRIRYQFVTGWPSGYGLVELAGYLNDLAASEPGGINVLRFYYGNHPYQGLDLYLAPSDSLAIYTFDPSSPDLLAQIEDIAAARRTFFVLNPPVEAEHLESSDKSLETYFKDARRVWYHPTDQVVRVDLKFGKSMWRPNRQRRCFYLNIVNNRMRSCSLRGLEI